MGHSPPAEPPQPAFITEAIALKLFHEFRLKPSQKLYVAFSGGMDSSVLLHALTSSSDIDKASVTALHANHGLHPLAESWQRHCEEVCQAWGVHYQSTRLDLPRASGLGLEASARQARYDWFKRVLPDAGFLITAHHFDDQVETILANLFRGAGVHGLAGMPETRALGQGRLCRPLLDIMRSTLHDYALAHGLHWLDDPANADPRHTRNQLRHSVIPSIKKSWPGVTKTISRAADNWRDTAALLDEIAAADLKQIDHYSRAPFFIASTDQLSALSRRRCLNVLRYWFKQCGFKAPSRWHLCQTFDSMISAQPKPTAVVKWPGVEIRRYRTLLYLSPPAATRQLTPTEVDTITTGPITFDNQHFRVSPAVGRGIKRYIYHSEAISIRARAGGEECRPAGHRHHRKLKKLLQEEGIPPWERDRVPLLYVGESLAAVIGVCYCQPFAAEADEPGMLFEVMA